MKIPGAKAFWVVFRIFFFFLKEYLQKKKKKKNRSKEVQMDKQSWKI